MLSVLTALLFIGFGAIIGVLMMACVQVNRLFEDEENEDE